MPYTVSQVARLTRLSVRALHHYDEIGLLRPSARTDAGYRLYGEADLDRLEQILFFRELAFPLEEIRRILDDPAFDRRSALLMQRSMLEERASNARALIAAVDRALDRALEALEGGHPLDDEKRFEAFDPSRYEDEVRERWGDTAQYRESARRTKGYSKEGWSAIRDEQQEITHALAAQMEAGTPPDAEAAMDLAERHRLHIDHRFYPCSHAMHRGLGEMYVEDARFQEHYERVRAGLASYVRDAIRANAVRQGGANRKE